jgi:diguanylate cyclase (GGDEF)-like protein
VLVWIFRRHDASLERWRLWQFVLMAALGALYGVTTLWIPLPGQEGQMAVINLWLGGLSVAAIMGQGIVASLGFAFAVPALAPMLGRLLGGSEPMLTALAIGNLLFFLYVCSIVIRNQRFTISEIEQRVMFEAMAAQLDVQKSHSDALVARLTTEIARRKRSQRALRDARDLARRQSDQDHLTELPNRRILELKLRQAWGRAQRERLPLSLILCDVDRFRAYNDRYGLHAGDLCLARIGKLIARRAGRDGDVVTRFGGEEFAILLPDTGEYTALLIADAIRSEVYEQTILHGASDAEKVVTVSCGVATIIPGPDEGENCLVESAALALKRAKGAGRNCVFTLFGNAASDGQ